MVKSMLDTKAEPIAMASQRERGLLCASVSWIIDSMRVGRVAKLLKCTFYVVFSPILIVIPNKYKFD